MPVRSLPGPEFRTAVRSFGNLGEVVGKELQGSLVEHVGEGLLHFTPVDTGQARGGWVFSVNRPSTARKTPLAKARITGAPIGTFERGNIGRTRKKLRASPLGLKAWIVNNQPYIQALNGTNGPPRSKKAPAGIIRPAFMRAFDRVNNKLKILALKGDYLRGLRLRQIRL